MTVTIARSVIRQVIGVEPVIVVVKTAAAKIAAVLIDKCLVCKTHASVDIGHHEPCAVDTHRPDVIRIYMCQVGFNGFHAVINNRGAGVGFIEDKSLSGGNGADFGETEQAVEGGQIGALDQDGVFNPVGLIFHPGILQISRHACLGSFGRLGKGVVDVPTPFRPAHVIRRGKVRLCSELNPVAGCAFGFHLRQHFRSHRNSCLRLGVFRPDGGGVEHAEEHANSQQQG